MTETESGLARWRREKQLGKPDTASTISGLARWREEKKRIDDLKDNHSKDERDAIKSSNSIASTLRRCATEEIAHLYDEPDDFFWDIYSEINFWSDFLLTFEKLKADPTIKYHSDMLVALKGPDWNFMTYIEDVLNSPDNISACQDYRAKLAGQE
jgi:hypothetical protein